MAQNGAYAAMFREQSRADDRTPNLIG